MDRSTKIIVGLLLLFGFAQVGFSLYMVEKQRADHAEWHKWDALTLRMNRSLHDQTVIKLTVELKKGRTFDREQMDLLGKRIALDTALEVGKLLGPKKPAR